MLVEEEEAWLTKWSFVDPEELRVKKKAIQIRYNERRRVWRAAEKRVVEEEECHRQEEQNQQQKAIQEEEERQLREQEEKKKAKAKKWKR